eukprot:TRINITY_DN16528_c0_g1::TRINITY_DN16528_c0_g1_i1::g.26976::m.26976 TRINITY_DN16528_c0_g1::TRINITY_DN16528_c0_g1_i1::g.26976  ORF type:complete len:383 (+),score=36.05 TRINITY_DN16528_c0_g1_i1:118-1266(+)
MYSGQQVYPEQPSQGTAVNFAASPYYQTQQPSATGQPYPSAPQQPYAYPNATYPMPMYQAQPQMQMQAMVQQGMPVVVQQGMPVMVQQAPYVEPRFHSFDTFGYSYYYDEEGVNISGGKHIPRHRFRPALIRAPVKTAEGKLYGKTLCCRQGVVCILIALIIFLAWFCAGTVPRMAKEKNEVQTECQILSLTEEDYPCCEYGDGDCFCVEDEYPSCGDSSVAYDGAYCTDGSCCIEYGPCEGRNCGQRECISEGYVRCEVSCGTCTSITVTFYMEENSDIIRTENVDCGMNDNGCVSDARDQFPVLQTVSCYYDGRDNEESTNLDVYWDGYQVPIGFYVGPFIFLGLGVLLVPCVVYMVREMRKLREKVRQSPSPGVPHPVK